MIAGGTALAWLFALAEPPRDSPRDAAPDAPTSAPRGAAPDDQAAPAIVLSVREIADDVLDERVIAAVRAHTRALGVRLAIVRHPAPLDPATLAEAGQALAQREAALGVLWIDVAADGAAVLYLVERARVYSRSLPAGGGAVRVESIANVVSQVVGALLEGQPGEGPKGLQPLEPEPRAAAEPPTPVPASPVVAPPGPAVSPAAPAVASRRAVRPRSLRPPQVWSRLRLRVAYTGSTFAAALPWHDGLALAVGWRPAPRVTLDLGYEVLLAARLGGDPVVLVLRRHPLALTGGYGWSVGRLTELRVGGRVALDIVRREGQGARPGVVVSDDTTRLFASIAALVGFAVRPGPRASAAVTLGLELVPRRFDYTVHAPDRRLVLSPSPVRFTVAVGLEFELLPRASREKKIDPVGRRRATWGCR